MITNLVRTLPKIEFQLLYSMDCGLLFLDPLTEGVVEVTEQVERLFACSSDEVRSLGLGLLCKDSNQDELAEIKASLRTAASGQTKTVELQVNNSLGHSFWLEVSFKPSSLDGKPCVMACLRDISRRMRALEEQQKLHKALAKRVRELECLYSCFSVLAEKEFTLEQVFRNLLDKVAIGFQYPDITCSRLTIDENVYMTEDFRPTPWHQTVPVLVNECNVGQLEVGYLEERPPADVGPFLREERKLLEMVAGRLGRIIERRRTKDELRRERDFARNLVETAQVIVLVLDTQRRIAFFNPFLEKLSGFFLEEVHGLDWFDTFRPPECRDGGKTTFREALTRDETTIYLGTMVDRKGISHQVEWSVRSLRDQAGDVSGLLCIGQDVTERLKVEKERNRLVAVVEQAAECIIITDTEGKIQYVNPAFERMTECAREEVSGLNISRLNNEGQDPKLFEAIWAYLKTSRTWKGRLSKRKKNGVVYNVECTISPIRDAEGNITNYVGHQREITQELRIQEHLRQSQKMEAVGILAGGIAHDFNNILGSIMGYTELAQQNLRSPDIADKHLGMVLKASDRAKDLVNQILIFCRQTEQEKRHLDLTLLIEESLKLLRASLPSTLELVSQTLHEPVTVLADPTQLHQVLMNLCTNAAHAMSQTGGRLAITTSIVAYDGECCPLCHEPMSGPYVLLEVSDTGHGIDPEIMNSIFEPFFTTKEVGQGTGLGLAVVYGIVKGHNGHIHCTSQVGQGTTFGIHLPQYANQVDAENEKATIQELGGNQRLLIVDDEKALVDILSQGLSGLGYRVQGFTSSQKALDAFLREPSAFDAVISDLTMRNQTGLHLARAMKALRPDLPFILCTGFSDSLTRQMAKAIGIQKVLQKPVSLVSIAEVIKKVLT